MKRTEFAFRLLLIYVAGSLGAIDAPGSLAAPFAVASIFLTAELASRSAGREAIDRIARLGGSIPVGLVLGGLVLNLLPAGLTRQSWSAFWVVVSLAVLWWKRNEPAAFRVRRFKPTPTSAWLALSAAVVVVSAVIATEGANKDLRSPMEMWLQGKSPGSITVAISSGSDGGPYRLVVDPEVTKTEAFDPFSLESGKPVERSLPVAGETRYKIHLVEERTGEPVRTLVVDAAPIA